MGSSLVDIGTAIIFAAGPLLAAFITGRQALQALQTGAAEWPLPLARTTLHFSKHRHPVRYWLAVTLFSVSACILAAIPIIYFSAPNVLQPR